MVRFFHSWFHSVVYKSILTMVFVGDIILLGGDWNPGIFFRAPKFQKFLSKFARPTVNIEKANWNIGNP